MKEKIILRGVRVHNLKNIDLDIPLNKMIVVTGVSGSGKSSLAFDTLYAEGQRRYVESLSSYARQFLGIMDKPDVDEITGLSPSISIDQKATSHNPRSTVGTITEIYDYLRVLFARLGHPHCPSCGKEISRLSPDEITDKILALIGDYASGSKPTPCMVNLLAPIVQNKKGEYLGLFSNLQSKGFQKARLDGKFVSLIDDLTLIKTNKHTIEVVLDTLSVSFKDLKDEVYLANIRSRLATAVEQALTLSDGLVLLNFGELDQLFSEKFSCPTCNISLPELEPRLFSFNSPLGACTTCKGLGTIQKIDPVRILNPKLSIKEGGILPFNWLFFHDTWYTRLLDVVADSEGIDLTLPIGEMKKANLDKILYGTGKTYRVEGKNLQGRSTVIKEKFDGVIARLLSKYYTATDHTHNRLEAYLKEEVCDACHGLKLQPTILAVTIDSLNIAELTALSILDLLQYLKSDLPGKLTPYEIAVGEGVLKEIKVRLTFLENVGLGYLDLARRAKTLSGGEQQRIRLASQIGTGLTGVLYVLDEPSIGLHPRDVSALIKSLEDLVELGNTLLVVEHDEETLRSASHLLELGPKAGVHGGHLVAEGTLEDIIANPKSLTGQYLSGKRSIPLNTPPLKNKKSLKLINARENNLKNITVEFPLQNLIGITGVSGSGKSSLITETLYPLLKYYCHGQYQDHLGAHDRLDGYQHVDRVYLVDQSPIGRTPRSNPATYVGIFDDIRELYAMTPEAKLRGFKKGRFSFNLKGGRCEKCQGGGMIKIEMQFLPDVYVKCDVCQGQRYNQETLEVKYKSLTIFDVLNLTIEDAVAFFRNHPRIFHKLELLNDIGLGYLTLGQPAPTLSGGEAQRLKLALELTRKAASSTVYLLDEPTTGLHFFDIEKLLKTLYRLVDQGNTVIVIEHNLDVIKNCQWIIDLGPEGGDLGGKLIFQGPTNEILDVKESYT
ncbi:MAG: excinuclease ABC subunit UvrA, partial [bacterium]